MSMQTELIESLIPHRKPFLFIDSIKSHSQNSILCLKKITTNDKYLVYRRHQKYSISSISLIECILQAGGCLIALTHLEDSSKGDSDKKNKYFIGSPALTFYQTPVLNDLLHIEVKIIQQLGMKFRLKGKIVSNSNLLLEGDFLVAEI